jgi:exodeoxyribonuclease VII large subunit
VAEPSRRGRERVESLRDRHQRAIAFELERRRQSLGKFAAQIEALSPLKVLSRGYSLTLKADGQTVVRASGDVREGEIVRTRLESGTLVSRVIESEEN